MIYLRLDIYGEAGEQMVAIFSSPGGWSAALGRFADVPGTTV
jgi:hypothetical protein